MLKLYNLNKTFAIIFICSFCIISFGQQKQENIELWYNKDLKKDSIPGTSLYKLYQEILQNKLNESNSVTIAVVDGQFDLNHEDLRNSFWLNEDEIPNNGIDDDDNGYVDDINGWNFIGAKNKHLYTNFSHTRFIRKYKHLFDDKDSTQIAPENILLFKEYKRALISDSAEREYWKKYYKSANFLWEKFPIAKDSLKKYFPKENYSTQQLDSLLELKTTRNKSYWDKIRDNDELLEDLIGYASMSMKVFPGSNTYEDLKETRDHADSLIQKTANVDYDERVIIGDTIEYLSFKSYGNNQLSKYKKELYHGTLVSGILAANRQNKIGTDGITEFSKILPICISGYGDEHDKDIALAIYYAVDSGAKIINISSGKSFSVYPEYMKKALKYAEKRNVLIITSAGNEGKDNDEIVQYPNDSFDGENEIVNNFIVVGASTKSLDKDIVSNFSNYGKQQVDIFAPGSDIYTTHVNDEYGYDDGTSVAAPMVSGVAALIWSYFPNLSAKEMKQIILESGTSIDLEVYKPGTEELVHFSELSKSGKILNAYNAYKMAEELSRKKK